MNIFTLISILLSNHITSNSPEIGWSHNFLYMPDNYINQTLSVKSYKHDKCHSIFIEQPTSEIEVVQFHEHNHSEYLYFKCSYLKQLSFDILGTSTLNFDSIMYFTQNSFNIERGNRLLNSHILNI